MARRSRVVVPRIQPGDPEAEGLLACYVAIPGGMMDLVSGTIGTRAGTADPTRSNELGRLDAYFDGNADQYAFDATSLISTSAPFTVVWEAVNDALTPDTYQILGSALGAGTGGWSIGYTSASGYTDIHFGSSSASWVEGRVSLAGIASVSGERHWGVLTYNGAGATTLTNFAVFLNGVAPTVSSGNALSNITDSNRVGGSNLTNTDWNGSVRQWRVYNRAWSQDEAVRFWHQSSRDSLFAPPKRKIFLGVAAGGSITLTINDATHGQTADGVSLTQQHQLAVQDASHAHAVDNLALTQQHELAVDDATHGHAADNLTLSTELTLSIADALHGHAVDNITLVQQHVLVVADATHGHSADNVVLETGTNLTIADATHAHTVDNLVLTQQHVLVVADAFHQHSADNVVLGGLPIAEVDEGGGGPDRPDDDEQPAERFTKDASGWRKPKWVREREQIEAAQATAPARAAEKPAVPVDEREALVASAQAAEAITAGLERVQPQAVSAAIAEQPADAASAQQTAAVDLERARVALKRRQQREIEEIMIVLMMAA